MSLTAQIFAAVRQASRSVFSSGGTQTPQINQGGDLLVSQCQPEHLELARLGGRWATATPIANAFAPVAASPTTLANLVLYNGYPAGGPCLVIDSVWVYEQTSITALSAFTLLAQISNAGVAAPTNNASCLVRGSTGKVYGGQATKAIANTAFAIAEMWEAIGGSQGSPAAGIGGGAYAEVKGRFIVRPSAALCLNVVASTAAGTCIQGVSWYELQIDLS